MMYNSIRQIQQTLKQEDLYTYKVDGICGEQTFESIIKAIQSDKYRLDFDFIFFKKLFNIGKLSQPFVDSLNHLFEKFNKYGISSDEILKQAANPLYIAYMLATAWHETSFTMLPIKEVGSEKYLSKYDTGRLAKILGNTLEPDGDGILYAGRGYSMITGKNNYSLFGNLLGVNLLGNPDLALNPNVASDILIVGSLKGLFTTKSLSDFIKFGDIEDFMQARKVINGTDKNTIIASYAKKFVECIKITKIK